MSAGASDELGVRGLIGPVSERSRSILHVDMDAFFASVECVDEPSLRGKAVLVGGTSGRGVVAAASYEARAYGCRSAMPMSQALRLCPHAVVRPVNFRRYREVSRKVFEIFGRFTPVVEGLSLDEAFLDLTGTEKLLGPAEGVARQIKTQVFRETQCTCSVGVSDCKFLAKLASDMNKPDGLTVLGRAEVETVLPGLPVTRIWGIGAKSAARLGGYAIHTIGDLRRCELSFLLNRFGSDAERLHRLARGIDERPVTTDREAKSIGQEQTFFENKLRAEEVRAELLGEVEHVAWRLRRSGLAARAVTVKIRSGDFRTVTRSRTLGAPTDVTTELWSAAREAFDDWAARQFEPVRLIGVQAKELTATEERQLGLFTHATHEKQSQVDAATDKIRARYGDDAIRRLGP